MTDADRLRAAARWMRKHGFTPHFTQDGHGCFVCALSEIDPDNDVGNLWSKAQLVIGSEMWCQNLMDAGWTGPECTDDAVAALEIAADLCT